MKDSKNSVHHGSHRMEFQDDIKSLVKEQHIYITSSDLVKKKMYLVLFILLGNKRKITHFCCIIYIEHTNFIIQLNKYFIHTC